MHVDGKIDAVGKITINASNKADALYIKERNENAKKLEMPDITSEIYAYVKETGKLVMAGMILPSFP